MSAYGRYLKPLRAAVIKYAEERSESLIPISEIVEYAKENIDLSHYKEVDILRVVLSLCDSRYLILSTSHSDVRWNSA